MKSESPNASFKGEKYCGISEPKTQDHQQKRAPISLKSAFAHLKRIQKMRFSVVWRTHSELEKNS